VHRPQQNSPLTLPLDYEIFEDCLKLSPSGRYLATRGDGGLMDVFDLRTDSTEPIYRLEAPCLTLAFSHREDLLVCGTQYGEVRVFRLSDGVRLPNLAEFRSFWAWGLGVAFSHDDRYLAVGTEAGKVQVWRMEDRQLIAELTGNRGEVRRIDFFTDGRRLVCDGAGIIRVWDFVAGQELLTLPIPEIDVKQLEVSQDERHLVAMTTSGHMYLWSVD
jgi:WD40 repeat protein